MVFIKKFASSSYFKRMYLFSSWNIWDEILIENLAAEIVFLPLALSFIIIVKTHRIVILNPPTQDQWDYVVVVVAVGRLDILF